ncbi:MAG TPA: YbgC/FadM family acyl-CoA thioesterase [Burkholderiaceae bacterium]|jgi:acyl-CoA thioester hydrolase
MTMKNFEHALRVYWEDTDAGGIVFYANYLKFFERARTEWLRAAGFEQQRLRDEAGLIFVVAATSVRYLSPAKLDDFLHITVEPREIGRASMTIFQTARRMNEPPRVAPCATLPPEGARVALGRPGADSTLLAEGEIRIGCVAAATLKTARIPVPILEALS